MQHLNFYGNLETFCGQLWQEQEKDGICAIVVVISPHNALPKIKLLQKIDFTDISVKETVVEWTKWTKGI